MANEIQFQAQLQVAKNGAMVSRGYVQSLTMAGKQMVQKTQSIGTVAETLSFGDITGPPAKLLIRNLDTVNYVTVAGDAAMAQNPDKILPGDFILRSPTSATIYAKANAAACDVEIVAAEA